MLAEVVKLGRPLAMLSCLDRDHRLVYVLGEVFDLDHRASGRRGVSEETLRQRLLRARRTLESLGQSTSEVA